MIPFVLLTWLSAKILGALGVDLHRAH